MRLRSGLTVFAALLASACASGAAPLRDPWLLGIQPRDCAEPACLFAVVQSPAGSPLIDAEIEISGLSRRTRVDGRGRIVLQAIPQGSRRIRVVLPDRTLELSPVSFGYTPLAVLLEVSGDTLRVTR